MASAIMDRGLSLAMNSGCSGLSGSLFQQSCRLVVGHVRQALDSKVLFYPRDDHTELSSRSIAIAMPTPPKRPSEHAAKTIRVVFGEKG